MESKFIVNSIGIGGAIFVGLVFLWFVTVYLKKRMTAGQSNQALSTSSKISWEEKRKHPRVAISWQGVVESRSESAAVQLKDISLGGAFVVCPQPLPLKEKFKISIHTPDHGRLLLNAEVVWSNINVPSDKVVNRGMGIRFIENTEENRKQLSAAITASFEERENQIA